MTNYEKYKDKLIKLAIIRTGAFNKNTNEPTTCNQMNCSDCLFDDDRGNCKNKFKNWLDMGYKEFEIDWSKVPVDTKVYVRNCKENEWIPRYFARVGSDGIPLVWKNGLSSFTSVSDSDVTYWNYIKLAEEDRNE